MDGINKAKHNQLGKRQSAGPAEHQPLGVIRADELYRLRELLRRMGWGEHALRQARAAGLRLIGFGRERFVLGSDVLAFFGKLADASGRKPENPPQSTRENSGQHRKCCANDCPGHTPTVAYLPTEGRCDG